MLAFLGGMYATMVGRRAVWGLLFAFFPGYLFTVTRDLTEVVLGCFLLAVLIMLRKKRYGYASVFLSFAVLTRETAVLMLVAIAISWLLREFWRTFRKGWILFSVPTAVFVLWHGWLYMQWQSVFPYAFALNIGLPFQGIAQFLQNNMPIYSVVKNLQMIEFTFLASLLLLVSIVLIKSSAVALYSHELLAWCLYGLVLVAMTYHVWNSDRNFMRVAGEWSILSFVLLLQLPSFKRRLVPLGLWQFTVWLIVARNILVTMH